MVTKKFFNGEIELLRVEDLAKTVGVHMETIKRYIRAGKLKARKIGKRYYVSKESLKEFVNAGEQGEGKG